MPSINLDSIQFYQPATKNRKPSEKRLMTLATDVPTVAIQGKPPMSSEPSNAIEVLDMTVQREPFRPFCELVPDLQTTESDTRGRAPIFLFDGKVFDNTPDTSNEPCIIDSGREGIKDFPSITELLFSAGNTQDRQQVSSSGEHLRRSRGKLDHADKNDCNEVASPTLKWNKQNGGYFISADGVDDGDIEHAGSEEHNEESDPSDTQPTSVESPEDDGSRYFTLYEKNECSFLNTSSSDRNILHSPAPGQQAHESNDGGCKDSKHDPTASKKKGDQWDAKEVGVNDEGEESNGNTSDAPSLRPMKKRSQPVTQQKPLRVKHHCSSSPLHSVEESELESESDTSSYAPSKPYGSICRSTSSRSKSHKGGASKHSKIMVDGYGSHHRRKFLPAVIYESQSSEGDIVDQRDVKQVRGRPRRDEFEVEKILEQKGQEYLVKWKGYPTSENTWHMEKDLKNCQMKLRQFHQRQERTGTTNHQGKAAAAWTTRQRGCR